MDWKVQCSSLCSVWCYERRVNLDACMRLNASSCSTRRLAQLLFFLACNRFFFFMTKKCFSIQIFTLQNRCGKSQMRNSFLVWTVPKLHCVRFYFWNLFYSSSKGNSAHTHTALLKRTLSWKKLTFYIWVLLSKPWTLLYCKNISIF